MGYVVLHLDKSPDNEVPMTAHIARTKMPPNAIPELTYLNEELVEYPKGVADRTEAINHRLNHAGLTRKIGTNQVRVIRVMLTGSQEDMKRLAQEGRLKAWCADNLTWLRKTFRKCRFGSLTHGRSDTAYPRGGRSHRYRRTPQSPREKIHRIG